MTNIRNICVYCGSSPGHDPRHEAAARALGAAIANAGIGLVFGGGSCGLMGVVARAALDAGGEVCGIIPDFLGKREIALEGLTELCVVADMHQRKQLMFEMSDAFAVLPGGFGTLDETFEILTWRKLALHDKPVLLVDIAGFWRPLLTLIDHVIGQGFAHPADRDLYRVVSTIAQLLAALKQAPAPQLPDQPDRL